MALSKEKKHEVVDSLAELLGNSKLTVMAKYQGLSVKDFAQLRKQSRDSGTAVHVAKNRLFSRALAKAGSKEKLSGEMSTGQLVYAFNSSDEVAPASDLANFAKTHPQVEFVGGISEDGLILSAEEINNLAALPSKQQLRGILAGTIAAPLSGLARVTKANLTSVLYVLNAKASKVE